LKKYEENADIRSQPDHGMAVGPILRSAAPTIVR
jgi:hypothetical protein